MNAQVRVATDEIEKMRGGINAEECVNTEDSADAYAAIRSIVLIAISSKTVSVYRNGKWYVNARCAFSFGILPTALS